MRKNVTERLKRASLSPIAPRTAGHKGCPESHSIKKKADGDLSKKRALFLMG